MVSAAWIYFRTNVYKCLDPELLAGQQNHPNNDRSRVRYLSNVQGRLQSKASRLIQCWVFDRLLICDIPVKKTSSDDRPKKDHAKRRPNCAGEHASVDAT